MDWWTNITEGQAIFLSAWITVLAAVAGVVLGWLLFGGKVKTLSEAVAQTEAVLEDHKANTTKLLSQVVEQVTSTLEATNTLRAQFADQAAKQDDVAEEAAIQDEPELPNLVGFDDIQLPQDGIDDFRERMVDAWDGIRAEIERIASDPEVDGRTRGKYGRVDRRSYWKLIELFGEDGTVDSEKYNDLYNAYEIWMKHRNGRHPPIADDLVEIEGIRRKVAPQA